MATLADSAPVLAVLTANGLTLAKTLKSELPGAEIHGLASRIADADVAVDHLPSHLQALHARGRPIVGVCSAAILIRALAPVLGDKRGEPPVIAVAEDGSAVVPLLGGHRGANVLAQALAAVLGQQAAITSAGDNRFGVALDAPPNGFELANPDDYKAFAAALLNGASVTLDGSAAWLSTSTLPFADDAPLHIAVTDHCQTGSDARLVYHPKTLTLGVGCERGTSAEEVSLLVRQTLASAGLAPASLAAVFSIDLKADELSLQQLADELRVPLRLFDVATLKAETPRLANPSDVVLREVGCYGVAEAAALAAAGPQGTLVVEKTKSKRATCALARAAAPVDASRIGTARGRLAVVGIGPGSPAWRTAECEYCVRAATDLVGYRLYLDLLGPLADGKTRHDFALGEEQQRVRHALRLAQTGRNVALVCSGDPGIYAMATLVFELIEQEAYSEWNRIDICVVPGVSALQAAAARSGAPLGHDFCAISLSDLLTPWQTIERRIRSAAEGDFVIAFYNPVSRRRTRQLQAAVDILVEHRAPDTPVVLARNLGRDTESTEIIRLDQLSPARVDMLTVVVVGASSTRRTGDWVYTPRGYADKPERLA